MTHLFTFFLRLAMPILYFWVTLGCDRLLTKPSKPKYQIQGRALEVRGAIFGPLVSQCVYAELGLRLDNVCDEIKKI